MMIGHPTVEVPPGPLLDDPTDEVYSPFSSHRSDGGNAGGDLVAGLRRFLPSNRSDILSDDEEGSGGGGGAADSAVDAYSCDHFRMYEFKVRRCTRGRSHDWTECPYAHPGEKARRRDPRKFHYSGAACPEFRKGSCRKGDACEYAHGVFECWLHPARYRTQPCKDGVNCRRRVCFFAHTPDQLRVITQQSPRTAGCGGDYFDMSPLKQAIEASCVARTMPFMASTSSISLEDSDSPPLSPMTQSTFGCSPGSSSVSDLVATFRNLQLDKVTSLPSSWNSLLGSGNPNYSVSPRGSSMLRSSCYSLPTTPTPSDTPTRPGYGYLDLWEKGRYGEEPVMERVESGRGLRARMFERLSKENPLELGGSNAEESSGAPDVGWVSELVM